MPPVTSNGQVRIPPNEIRLALNLWDIDHINPLVKESILAGKLDTGEAIWVDKSRPDETAVVFACNLLTAALTIDILRSEQRKGSGPPLRAYLHRKTWTRLSHSQVLTIIEDGKAKLNPDIFAENIVEELLPALPLAAEKIIIGGRKK